VTGNQKKDEPLEIDRLNFVLLIRRNIQSLDSEVERMAEVLRLTDAYEINGHRVKYYVTPSGKISYEVVEKERMGF
jgi:hypothetical protein